MTAEDQAFHMGQAWEALPEPKRQFNFYVVDPSGQVKVFYIGPHAPQSQPGRCAIGAQVVAEYAPRSFHARPAP